MEFITTPHAEHLPDPVFHWAWLILLAPIVGFLFQAALGRRIELALGKTAGRRLLGFAAVVPVAAGFILSVLLAVRLAGMDEHSRLVITSWFPWIDLQTLLVPFELRLDPLSLTMCLIVTGVGSLIHVYATGYMADDGDYSRFFTYFNLFIAFMLMLAMGNNLPLVFIGWEGVGLCSYLLIGYWYHDIENAKAANKAFIVNRIGDWGFALGIFLLYWVYASNQDLLPLGERRYLSFDVILPLAEQVLAGYGPLIVSVIPLLLFVGAVGKSAQWPLYLWLPDAMAGPTPVSALIHAATMVTAGVYLVARTHVFFELSTLSMAVVAGIGAFTALFAATVAFGQTDIKKVLAYSTVSQLGYMFLACGVGAFGAGMFHVTTHAFFKALLFLGSGAVIVAMSHNQDLRKYGNLRKYIPITCWTMLIGWLAIAGIPPFAGFWSKDEILASAFFSNLVQTPQILWFIGWVTAFLTAGYMTRMMMLTFYGNGERWRTAEAHAHADHSQEHFHADHGAQGEHDLAYFLTDDEVRAIEEEEHEHHHGLTPEHEPREVLPSMWVPLVALAALSLVGGAALSGLNPFAHLLGVHIPHLFEAWNHPSVGLSVLDEASAFRESIAIEWALIGASIGAAVLGIGLFARRYIKGLPESEAEPQGLQRLAGEQWLYDRTMVRLFVDAGGKFANAFYRIFDSGIIDGIFVNGSAKLVGAMGLLLRRSQTGSVRFYALAIAVGVVFALSYVIYTTTR
ncbi:MAG: NADH-quinone oxidoreductase subunit L [Armatimonadota bacterium]